MTTITTTNFFRQSTAALEAWVDAVDSGDLDVETPFYDRVVRELDMRDCSDDRVRQGFGG